MSAFPPLHADDSRGVGSPNESELLAADGVVPLGRELNSSCPCCDVPLRAGEIDGHPVLYCGECGGVLMRNGAFGTVLRDRRSRHVDGEPADVRPLDRNAALREIDCPSCGRRMETHPYYGPGNVMIDSCSHCELVWLDHAELADLASAVAPRRPRW